MEVLTTLCVDNQPIATEPRYSFRGVEAMFESVFIPLRCSRGRSPVHPTSAVRHRRRLAGVPAPCCQTAANSDPPPATVSLSHADTVRTPPNEYSAGLSA